jgi:hypothetical protein
MTFSITTLSIMTFNPIIINRDTRQIDIQHNGNVIMQNGIMLSVVMLRVVAPNIILD